MNKVFVTKSFLPPLEEYQEYIRKVFANGQLTNQGELVEELERQLRDVLHVNFLHYVTNGTVAMQIGLNALGIREGEIITTPFSYVATVSSILWERCMPVFVDVEPGNFCIDPHRIEAAITEKTRAILPVHVFGYACDVQAIQGIADRYNLKVLYDGAHAFGSCYENTPLLAYGDAATCSFHATKLFHTGEGGACIVRDAAVSDRLDVIKRFGHYGDDHRMLGINAKQSELHAAMGLCNLPYLADIIAARKAVSALYDTLLEDCVGRPKHQPGLRYNYAYYPVLFADEAELLRALAALNALDIYPRRYFHPSLNTLPYLAYSPCPVAEDIAARIACLPLYVGLEAATIETICATIRNICHDRVKAGVVYGACAV